jgi:hypothetical protein
MELLNSMCNFFCLLANPVDGPAHPFWNDVKLFTFEMNANFTIMKSQLYVGDFCPHATTSIGSKSKAECAVTRDYQLQNSLDGNHCRMCFYIWQFYPKNELLLTRSHTHVGGKFSRGKFSRD